MLLNNITEELDKLKKFIYDNDESFLKEFTNLKYPELTGVWFSSNSLKINYWDMDTRRHFSDIVPISELCKWLEINDYEVLITAEMVRELRELSNSPLSVCKRALFQTNGNVELANELLTNNGIK